MYLICLLGQYKEHNQKTRSIPEHGMPEPAARSCGLPQRTANINIAAPALDGLSRLSTVSWSAPHSSPEERDAAETQCKETQPQVFCFFPFKHLILNNNTL